jgi:hypothetical protein
LKRRSGRYPVMPAAAGGRAGREEHPCKRGHPDGRGHGHREGAGDQRPLRTRLGTTKWIVNDRTSDVRSIVRQIGKVPILARTWTSAIQARRA